MRAVIEVWQSMDLCGKGICVTLVVMSVYMWGLILAKLAYLSTVERGNKRLVDKFRPFQAQFARDYLQLFRDIPVNSDTPLYVLYRAVCDHLRQYRHGTTGVRVRPWDCRERRTAESHCVGLHQLG